MEYKFHPAADAFPMMNTSRTEELSEDIKKHGLLQPIVLCEGMILDGRNRYRVCLESGIEPRFVEYQGNPWDMAWSMNGQRRDLVQEQRYLIWKFCNEHGESWQTEQRRIQDEANRKRSEAADARRGEDGRLEAKPVQPQSVAKQDYHETKASAAKAKASKTNRGSVERGDRLATERPDLAEKVRLGEIKPAEAHRLMKRDNVAEKVSALPEGKYRIIYADPPWAYNDKQAVKGDFGTGTGAAEGHYPSMTISEICALPIQDMTQEDAVLFLWVTSPLLPEGLKVVDAWGFKYKAAFIWDKIKHNMGHYNSVRHEFLLVCTKGSCMPDVSKLFDSVQSIERSNKHSHKPEEFRDIINTIYPHGSRIELFRRGDAPEGWETWGNEANDR